MLPAKEIWNEISVIWLSNFFIQVSLTALSLMRPRSTITVSNLQDSQDLTNDQKQDNK
jgi:hypothetical protein